MSAHRQIHTGHHMVAVRPPAYAASSTGEATPQQGIVAALDRLTMQVAKLSAPWLTFPPDGESFLYTAGIVMPAMDGNFHTIVSFAVPNARNGALYLIANDIGAVFQNNSGDLIWQIQRNAGGADVAAERNYEKVQAVIGLSDAPSRIAPIRIFENDVISLVVQNVNVEPAGQFLNGVLGGHFYPKTWDDEYEQSQQNQNTSW
jgi:hypothetical protein